MVSVGIVAEGKYLTRDGVKHPREIFHREVEQNQWIKDHLATGQSTGDYYITSEYSRHSRHCAAPGLLLVGETIHQGLLDGDLSPARFTEYGATMRQGVENMRKLVYAFYNPDFSFREVIKAHPEAGGLITDCLSGDVNKDFTQLWTWFKEFVPLPDDLPYGEPLAA